MTTGIGTVVYPVKDLATAKAIFTRLIGAEAEMDQPYYVGWKVGGQDIGLDPNGHTSGMTGPVSFWHVEDINGTIKDLLEAGATVNQEVKDVGGGKLVGSVKDADGNVIGLVQPS